MTRPEKTQIIYGNGILGRRGLLSLLILISLYWPISLIGQYALEYGYLSNTSLWPARSNSSRFISTGFTSHNLDIIDRNDSYVHISTGFPIGRNFGLGLESSVGIDRFFTRYYWNLWANWDLSRFINVAISGDLCGYAYSPGDASIGDENDPLASENQSKLAPSFSVGAGFSPTGDLSLVLMAKNILRPNMALGSQEKSRDPTVLSTGLTWRFGRYVPFGDVDLYFDNEPDFDFRGGIVGFALKNRLGLLCAVGNDGLTAGASYDFGEITVGYEFKRPFGDPANIYGNSHSAHIELRSFEPEPVEIELPDTTDYICPSNPLIAEWAIVRKGVDSRIYDYSIQTQTLDSAIFYLSPGRNFKMSGSRNGELWRVKMTEFPGPTCWIAGFKDGEGFCLEHIYNNPAQATRMTVAMEEYVAVIPFVFSNEIIDSIAVYSDLPIPFYLDSDDERKWEYYLDWQSADRFLFAAPTYNPDPPEIRLASEFAVEKIDNRLHAEVAVAVGRIPHRLLATSSWAGDCAVFSNNPHDTLTFIVPNEIPDSIPIVVTGSATDAWMRVHKIGPDTLDNEIIAKVWDNTDYSLFNFVYFAENDDNCRGDIDPHLKHLIDRAKTTDGKLLITGYRYRDALCAYNHARKTLPATQVRIDPSLIPPSVRFEGKWIAPDSIWFINNFSQAIIMWEDIPQPADVAGYIVFADNKPIPEFALYDSLAYLQLNREPIVGNMFIISEISPDIPVYARIAPITGKGQFGELSNQITIQTKARRKTTVYEFSSKLGNPSAFDFSEYREVSMLSVNAEIIDLYLGTDVPEDGYGNLELKSPSIVESERTIWKSRNAGILMMDVLPLQAPYDVQEITSIDKKQSEPCRVGTRYLVRTPDGYELVIRVESVEGEFPDRRIDIQYLYRLVETAPVFDWNE